MSKMILGLDLGSNSLGWALIEADEANQISSVKDAGVRIFPKAVEKKTPTPKNQKRRNKRLARRVIQRRARRKEKLLNYLISLNLLPAELCREKRPEAILNSLGDPYILRARALDEPLKPHELGRALLHLVQRRGFLSNKKTLLGRDMLDDPDVLAVLEEVEEQAETTEETAFKAEISQLRGEIESEGCRTLGEFLARRGPHECKRNRDGQHLRTDRQMYRDELELIFAGQSGAHPVLSKEVQQEIENIIFFQRPLKLRKDRVGKCSLESGKKRSAVARLEYQRFRYLQDINNLKYFDPYEEKYKPLTAVDRQKLIELFEASQSVTFAKIKSTLGLDKKCSFNLDSGVKKIRGNTTAASINALYPVWGSLTVNQRQAFVDDLLSIKKKSALKRRLIGHWQIDPEIAVKLCLLELEPDFGNVSLKAIRKLLPHLERGLIYSDARVEAGYGYEKEEVKIVDRLGLPPTLPNPIVNKALHELRRVVNAIIAEYGKPDVIRIEMARDLEMNTKRYKSYLAQQKKNTKANDEATEAHQRIAKEHPSLQLSRYPSRDQKIRYRLWKDQGHCCAYSGETINLAKLFSADIEVDHILPYSLSLDDSYMNKVVCFARQNQLKGQRTPADAFGSNEEQWEQITQAISRWPKELSSKRDRFFKRSGDLSERDFIGNQLTDTRYISKEAGKYLEPLGADITFTRGIMTDWLRRQWQLNDLIGETDGKERSDHRHHAIDAAVTACIDRKPYKTLVDLSRECERNGKAWSMRDIHIDPPLLDIRAQLARKLEAMIVSHVPQRKITGALHEETGVGFIEGVGTVYRRRLDKDFSEKKVESIVDGSLRELVASHLKKHGNDPRVAFADGFQLYHKDGCTPIKRVRVVQAKKIAREKLEKIKFPITDKLGNTFKWHAYGNTHHVEILRHTAKEDKYVAHFVTAMEVARRARFGDRKTHIVQREHGEEWVFLMALHIDDLVEVHVEGEKRIYRVQKLNMVNATIALRLHTAADINRPEQGIEKSAGALVRDFQMYPVFVNAIGKWVRD